MQSQKKKKNVCQCILDYDALDHPRSFISIGLRCGNWFSALYFPNVTQLLYCVLSEKFAATTRKYLYKTLLMTVIKKGNMNRRQISYNFNWHFWAAVKIHQTVVYGLYIFVMVLWGIIKFIEAVVLIWKHK